MSKARQPFNRENLKHGKYIYLIENGSTNGKALGKALLPTSYHVKRPPILYIKKKSL